MLCYRDRAFCDLWKFCKKGSKCDRALTPMVELKAAKLGLGVQIKEKWECFDRMPSRPKLEW